MRSAVAVAEWAELWFRRWGRGASPLSRSDGSSGPAVRSALAGPGCSRGGAGPARWRLLVGGVGGGSACGGAGRGAGRGCCCPGGAGAAGVARRGPAPARKLSPQPPAWAEGCGTALGAR